MYAIIDMKTNQNIPNHQYNSQKTTKYTV